MLHFRPRKEKKVFEFSKKKKKQFWKISSGHSVVDTRTQLKLHEIMCIGKNNGIFLSITNKLWCFRIFFLTRICIKMILNYVKI